MLISFAIVLLMQAPPAAVTKPPFLEMLDKRFVRDLRDKKIDDVLTLYTPEAIFVNPDGSQATGPGLRKLYEQVAAAFDSDLHLQCESIKRDLNTVLERGTYTEQLRHRDTGKVDRIHGTYHFTVHKDADGRWRYSRMQWQ